MQALSPHLGNSSRAEVDSVLNECGRSFRCKCEIAPVTVLGKVPTCINVFKEHEAPWVMKGILGKPLQQGIFHTRQALEVHNAGEFGKLGNDVQVHAVDGHALMNSFVLKIFHGNFFLPQMGLQLLQSPTLHHINSILLLSRMIPGRWNL